MVVLPILSLSLSGTRRLMAQHGSTLVCVRYRNEPLARKRCKTVEHIVAEQSSEPLARPSTASVARWPNREGSEVSARTS